jgi:hypothetical protein
MRRRDGAPGAVPPAELLEWCGAMPFYPGRDRCDLEVVAALRGFHDQLGAWCAARSRWSGEHGWPDEDEERLADEQELWEWDPTAI